MPTTADDHSAFGPVMRALGVAALVAGVAVLLVFAAAAAVVVGLLITGAAIALRFAPQPARANAETLEARHTPTGWVVETRTRRSS